MRINSYFRKTIAVALLVVQLLSASQSHAASERSTSDRVITESGREGTVRSIPPDTEVGDHVIDEHGVEWVATGTEKVNGRESLFFEQFRGSDADKKILDIAEHGGLGESRNLPEFSGSFARDWTDKPQAFEARGFGNDFDGDRFTNGLRDQMGEGAYGQWSKQVADYLNDPKSLEQPIPESAPYPDRSIPPVNDKYLRSIDEFLEKVVDKMGKVQSNIVAYGVAQASSADNSEAWACNECGQISNTPNFGDESERAGDQAGGFHKEPFVPSSSDKESHKDLIEYSFTMPQGPERKELEKVYGRLSKAAPLHPQGQTAKLIGLSAVVEADKASAQGDSEGFEFNKDVAIAMADIALGISPLGFAKDVAEAVTGASIVDGHELTDTERALAVFGVVTVGVGSKIGSIAKAGEKLARLAKASRGGAAIVEALGEAVNEAVKLGAKTRSGFNDVLAFTKRTLGNQVGSVGEMSSRMRSLNSLGTKVSKELVSDLDGAINSLKDRGTLPSKFIKKEEATQLGWSPRTGNLHDVAPGKSIGGDVFSNAQGALPKDAKYFEADLGYQGGFRGKDRLVYSNEGKFFLTTDHYETFVELKW